MPFVWGMGGVSVISLNCAIAAQPSQLIMQWYVIWEVSQLYATTRSEISQLLWSLRSVTMFPQNPCFNHSLESISLISQPIPSLTLDLTFVHEIFGVLDKMHILMSGCFIPTRQVTAPQPSLPRIGSIKPSRRESMLNEFSRLNMVFSLHLSSLLQEEWAEKQLHSIKDLLTRSQPNRKPRTQKWWDGFAAAFHLQY